MTQYKHVCHGTVKHTDQNAVLEIINEVCEKVKQLPGGKVESILAYIGNEQTDFFITYHDDQVAQMVGQP